MPEKNNKNTTNKISYDPKDQPFKTSWSATSQIQEALIHHRHGRLEQAKSIYEALIQSDPNNSNAWHLLGVIAMQTKDFPQAELFIDKALALSPNSAEFLYNRAMLEVNRSKDIDALSFFNKSLNNDPQYRPAKFQLALCLSRLGRSGDMDKAINILTQLITSDEHFLDGYFQLAIIYRQLSKYDNSIECFKNLIGKNNNIPEAYVQLGYTYKLARKLSEAVEAYTQALQLKPNDPSFLNMRGVAYYELSDFPKALADYESALKLDNSMAEIYTNMGILLFEMGEQDRALQSFNQAIQCDHDFVSAYLNLAHCYEKLKKISAAIDVLDKALGNNPLNIHLLAYKADLLYRNLDFIHALDVYTQLLKHSPTHEWYTSRGLCHYYLAQFDLARKDYEQAININDQYALAQVNLAILELLQGDYVQGFARYESRKYLADFELDKYFDPNKEWTDQALKQKTILVLCEQGLGDVIFFGRYLQCLLALEAHVIFVLPLELVKLYHDWIVNSNIKNLTLIKKTDLTQENFLSSDYFIRLLSLPFKFLTHIDKVPNIPDVKNYLNYNKKKRSLWEMTLGIKKNTRVGLFWSSHRRNTLEERNNISLAYLVANLLELLPKEYDYISLQISSDHNELSQDEESRLMRDRGIQDYHDKIHDFSDTAALIACMDFVITVDTAVAHLSASLKKPTYLLLPQVPDWRWLLDREDSPWYPDIQIFRQEKSGDWSGALKKLSEKIIKKNIKKII